MAAGMGLPREPHAVFPVLKPAPLTCPGWFTSRVECALKIDVVLSLVGLRAELLPSM